MDMLSHVRKYIVLFLIFVVLFCSSCQRKSKNNYMIFSKNYVTNTEYMNTYESVLDTINNWKINSAGNRSIWALNYKLDSTICFNKAKNKLVTSFLVQCNDIDCVQDDLHFFYGIKIKNKWFFFKGASIVLPREYYQKNIHTPLNFEKLHEIAMKEVFNGYLKKKDKGFWDNLSGKTEWEINEDFFNEINLPRVPFKERKTNLNTYYSCRELDDKKEYEDCFFRHEALSVWNEDSTSVIRDTYLYSPGFPVSKKIRQLKKGDLLRVMERIDNSEWCYVRMWDGNPYMGFIKKETILKRKKK